MSVDRGPPWQIHIDSEFCFPLLGRRSEADRRIG